MNFTQNIDCLELAAGVWEEKIVEAHGSFARQSCIECKSPFPTELMQKAVAECKVPHCQTPQCNGLVKPEIVFFGEQLPARFHQHRTLPAAADAVIVMGTSLSVQPFASLPGFAKEGVPRLLINKERVGGMGSRPDDVLLLGDCDDGVRTLATALGWQEELEEMFHALNPRAGQKAEEDAGKTRDEKLEDEITKLTQDVDRSLKLSGEHTARIQDGLDREKTTAVEETKGATGLGENSTVLESKNGELAKADEHIEKKDDTVANGGGLSHVFVSNI
jgi:NAD-dependent histone deacetylase SIR2